MAPAAIDKSRILLLGHLAMRKNVALRPSIFPVPAVTIAQEAIAAHT